jgi:two-component system LytT family response regulator
MKTIIIDDSELDRRNLKTLLKQHAQFELVGQADSVGTARELIESEQPDLVFLDIHLGKEKGFDVLDDLESLPLLVLTTSHPQYALEGYEVEALDYILKPVTPDNLERALARVMQRQQGRAEQDVSGAEESHSLEALQLDSPLFLKKLDDFCVHPVKDVVRITTDRPYTVLHIRGGTQYLHRRSMTEWKTVLPRETFLALDRSTIINIQAVDKLSSAGDRYCLKFTDEATEPTTITSNAFKILRDALHG